MFILLLFAAACAGPGVTTSPVQPQQSAPTAGQEGTAIPTNSQDSGQPQPELFQLGETVGPDCLSGGTNRIGQAIDDEYEYASYEEVMTWFCNGAEFEDILVALQTEDLTGTPAEEMLAMLADGFTWEEIWLVVGLTE